MAEFPALPLWTDAYLGDTTHLTTIEHGAYLLLLMSMWRNGGGLPDDDKLLARYARLTLGQWQRMAPTIRAFFKVQDGAVYQGRLTDELEAVRQHSKKQSNNVKSRWLKTKETSDTKAIPDMPFGNTPLPLPLTLPKVEEGGGGSAGEKPEISPQKTFRENLLAAMGVDPVSGLTGRGGARIGTQGDMIEAGRWITGLGLTEAECVAEVADLIRAKRDGPPSRFTYFSAAMARLAAAKSAPPPEMPIQSQSSKGPRQNERAAFDRTINAIADGLNSGTIHIDNSRSDPFAALARRNAQKG